MVTYQHRKDSSIKSGTPATPLKVEAAYDAAKALWTVTGVGNQPVQYDDEQFNDHFEPVKAEAATKPAQP